ncbi:MAG: 50S ribosomal protein L25/general stress protein Ctc [Gammaproteobacteria bacterium]|nr:50S ribosomal protein L25/general stress protein Ctc [Gammaproteobacteria bacterium]
MSTGFEIRAEPRDTAGSSASRRLRHAGKVPAVIYGAGKENMALTLDHDEVLHQLSIEAFHSAILNVKVGDQTEQAILRAVQMHPFRPRLLHVDFQRVSATEEIHIAVPLHFMGEEEAPGIKIQSGILSRLMTEVDVSCLPKDLPEYFEIDVSHLDLNESVHLSEIKVPEGVTITGLAHGGEDLAVVSILAAKIVVEEEEVEAEEEMVEGEEAEAEGVPSEGEPEKSEEE